MLGLSSAVGLGSTFGFAARLAKAVGTAGLPAPFRAGAAEIRLAQQIRGRRVLRAGPEPINREISQELLQSVGLVVDTVAAGLAAGLAAVGRMLHQAYDLVWMDRQLPTLDGLEGNCPLGQLSTGENLPVVVMTANGFDEDRLRCLAAGTNDFLAKPTDTSAFFDTVLRWLDRPAA
jgi:two-component system sensor histidine kinase/response regulator